MWKSDSVLDVEASCSSMKVAERWRFGTAEASELSLGVEKIGHRPLAKSRIILVEARSDVSVQAFVRFWKKWRKIGET